MLCCPRCRSELHLDQNPIRCSGTHCIFSRVGFPCASDQPVLIAFEHSIIDRAAYQDHRGSVFKRDDTGKGLRVRVRRMLTGSNPVTPAKSREMIAMMKRYTPRPDVLVIG